MTLKKLLPAACLLVFSILTFNANAQIGHIGPANRQVVNCSSSGYRYNTCYVGDIEFVRLANQISRSACIEGRTWGYTYDSIWVDQGCRANFEVFTRDFHQPPHHPPYNPPHNGYEEVLSCASTDYRFNSCYPSSGGRINYVVLDRQVSRTACVEGNNWGYDSNRVWVDGGCRGQFRVYTY
jgi:hypothetical protein